MNENPDLPILTMYYENLKQVRKSVPIIYFVKNICEPSLEFCVFNLLEVSNLSSTIISALATIGPYTPPQVGMARVKCMARTILFSLSFLCVSERD